MEHQEFPKIPSELIEPHLQKFLGTMLEMAAYGDIQEVKQMIRGLDIFVGLSSGKHAVLAFSHHGYDIRSMPDDELRELARNIVEAVSNETTKS